MDEGIAATGASSARDMGKVMGWLSPKTKGRADGKHVSELVVQALAPGATSPRTTAGRTDPMLTSRARRDLALHAQ